MTDLTITNYAELKAFLALASMRSDLTTVLGVFINAAHARIAAKGLIMATLSLNASSVALPADFGRLHNLYVVSDPAVLATGVSADQLTQLQAASADLPQWFNVSGLNLGLGPSPDQTYEGRLVYRVSATKFAADGDTNAILQAYPMLYVHAAQAEIARFIFDSDAEGSREALFAAELEAINQAELAKALDGLALQLSPSSSVV